MTRTKVVGTYLFVISLACVGFSSVVGSPTLGQTHTTPTAYARGTVQLDGMNKPLLVLGDALKQKPHTSQFRIKWFQIVLSEDYNSTALYDRRNHTLIFDCRGHWDGGRMHETTFYTKVTDAVILSAAKANQRSMQEDFLAGGFRAYFDTLAFYGAKVQSKHQE